jgi:hypothetical protein
MEMALIQAESNMNVRSMLCEFLLDPSPLLLKSGLYLLPVLTYSHCTIQTQKHFISKEKIHLYGQNSFT